MLVSLPRLQTSNDLNTDLLGMEHSLGVYVGRLHMVLCGLVIRFSRLHVSLRLVGAAVRASSESTRVTSLVVYLRK
jgi:hypothetical protein